MDRQWSDHSDPVRRACAILVDAVTVPLLVAFDKSRAVFNVQLAHRPVFGPAFVVCRPLRSGCDGGGRGDHIGMFHALLRACLHPGLSGIR